MALLYRVMQPLCRNETQNINHNCLKNTSLGFWGVFAQCTIGAFGPVPKRVLWPSARGFGPCAREGLLVQYRRGALDPAPERGFGPEPERGYGSSAREGLWAQCRRGLLANAREGLLAQCRRGALGPVPERGFGPSAREGFGPEPENIQLWCASYSYVPSSEGRAETIIIQKGSLCTQVSSGCKLIKII